jgi:hypothetical protein
MPIFRNPRPVRWWGSFASLRPVLGCGMAADWGCTDEEQVLLAERVAAYDGKQTATVQAVR